MRTTLKNAAISAAATALLSAPALAQDLGVKAPPQERPTLIAGALIHTVSNGSFYGYIEISDGVISAVRNGPVQASDGFEFINAAGMHVYPAMIGANTAMGLSEVGAVRATRDTNETGGVTPEARAVVAINPDSWHMPVTRSNGVLVTAVMPSGGVIPGTPALIHLDGWTWEDMAIEPELGVVVNWPRMRPITAWWMNDSREDQMKERDKNLRQLDEFFSGAKAYFAAKSADDAIPESVRYEAVRDVFEGDKPLFILAQELEEIQSAVSWAAERSFKAVIVGGRDAALCAKLLNKHDVPVVITGTHRMPRRADSAYDEAFTLPLALEEAGVKYCIATGGGSSNERNLPYNAAMAAAYGLDRDAALRAITLSPAEILGVDDRLGSIEQGKHATLIITDGDPLEIETNVQMAFINGRRIDLSNKQTELAEKYREKYRQLDLIPEDGE